MKKEIIELEDLPSISVKEFAGNFDDRAKFRRR